ncbi:MAG: hypothetical protein IIC22_07405 [Chloroflexi bacterium]|nr:hypothetical protein [Chloroflexota bacterium]
MQAYSKKLLGLFSRKGPAKRDEESLSLRMIVLVIGIEVAFSLGWVGAPLWAWVIGSVLLGLGHAHHVVDKIHQRRPIIPSK